MNSKLGPIQPDNYGVPGDKKLNYVGEKDKYACRIINDDQRIVVANGWYKQWHVADVDPNEVNSKNRRDYIKEVLDNVDWDNLNNYPDSTLGVNLEQVITDQTGDAKIETYHYKLNRMKMAGLKLIWRGQWNGDAELHGEYANRPGWYVPSELRETSGKVLATFDHKLIKRRGFFVHDWWPLHECTQDAEVHVVLAHESVLAD